MLLTRDSLSSVFQLIIWLFYKREANKGISFIFPLRLVSVFLAFKVGPLAPRC